MVTILVTTDPPNPDGPFKLFKFQPGIVDFKLLTEQLQSYWDFLGVPISRTQGDISIHFVEMKEPIPFVGADPVIGAGLIKYPEFGTPFPPNSFKQAIIPLRPYKHPDGTLDYPALAKVAAHEAGHAFGLSHHPDPNNVMHDGPGTIWSQEQIARLKENLSGTTEKLIRNAYAYYLGRFPLVPELLAWIALDKTIVEKDELIELSDESINRLYWWLLGRGMEDGAAERWRKLGNIEQIAMLLVSSPEAWENRKWKGETS